MLNITDHDNAIREIQLARPPVNALNLELLRALRSAIDESVRNGVRGIVLSGAMGLFSAGVDVPALLARDRAGVREYWRELFALCGTLACAPVPLVAAITGHSPAGGAVLALFCDYRVMAEGPYRIGLNEVQVGLIVPEAIQLALRRVVGTYRAERLLVSGAMLEASDALACGFVDELTGVDQVTTRACTGWVNCSRCRSTRCSPPVPWPAPISPLPMPTSMPCRWRTSPMRSSIRRRKPCCSNWLHG